MTHLDFNKMDSKIWIFKYLKFLIPLTDIYFNNINLDFMYALMGGLDFKKTGPKIQVHVLMTDLDFGIVLEGKNPNWGNTRRNYGVLNRPCIMNSYTTKNTL